MELKDLMELKALEGNGGMSPYEHFKVQNMQAKSHTSGLGVAGLCVGIGAAVAAVAAGAWAGSRAQNAKDVALAKNDGLRDLVQSLATTVAAERQERINGDYTITQSVSDTITGQQSGTQSQSTSVTQDVVQQVVTGLMTGRYSENAQKVELMSPAQPFKCGCGCGD